MSGSDFPEQVRQRYAAAATAVTSRAHGLLDVVEARCCTSEADTSSCCGGGADSAGSCCGESGVEVDEAFGASLYGVVAENHLSASDRAERGSCFGCIAGAPSKSEYLDGAAAVGFTNAEVSFTHEAAPDMHSATVRAVRPA